MATQAALLYGAHLVRTLYFVSDLVVPAYPAYWGWGILPQKHTKNATVCLSSRIHFQALHPRSDEHGRRTHRREHSHKVFRALDGSHCAPCMSSPLRVRAHTRWVTGQARRSMRPHPPGEPSVDAQRTIDTTWDLRIVKSSQFGVKGDDLGCD